jgi:hypothetical protein
MKSSFDDNKGFSVDLKGLVIGLFLLLSILLSKAYIYVTGLDYTRF